MGKIRIGGKILKGKIRLDRTDPNFLRGLFGIGSLPEGVLFDHSVSCCCQEEHSGTDAQAFEHRDVGFIVFRGKPCSYEKIGADHEKT